MNREWCFVLTCEIHQLKRTHVGNNFKLARTNAYFENAVSAHITSHFTNVIQFTHVTHHEHVLMTQRIDSRRTYELQQIQIDDNKYQSELNTRMLNDKRVMEKIM